jgi:hypothetical protein
MISKKVYLRLARLEVEMAPPPEPKVWQIVYMGCDGIQKLGDRIEWYPPRDRRLPGKTVVTYPNGESPQAT